MAPTEETLPLFISNTFGQRCVTSPVPENMLLPRTIAMARMNPRLRDASLSTAEFSESKVWALLFRSLGLHIFEFLFQRCSMFRRIPEFNFLQLSGPFVAQTFKSSSRGLLPPSTDTKMAKELLELRKRADNKLQEHLERLKRWKKRKADEKAKNGNSQFLDEDEVSFPKRAKIYDSDSSSSSPSSQELDIAALASKRDNFAPKKENASKSDEKQYKLEFRTIHRSHIYYKHSTKVCFGFPIGWKALVWKADENGSVALASWIFAKPLDSLPRRVVENINLFKAILKRLHRIHFRSILGKYCPLPQLSEGDELHQTEEKEYKNDQEAPIRQIDLTLVTQSRGRKETSEKNVHFPVTPSFNPRLSQLHTEDPIMMSSGIRPSGILQSSTKGEKSESKTEEFEMPLLTQFPDSLTQKKNEKHWQSQLFDYDNEDDQILDLLIEPQPNPVFPQSIASLLPMFSRHHQVSQFVSHVLRKLLPLPTLGSEYNWRLLDAKVSKFVGMNRFDTISSKQLLEGFKVTEVPWLSANAGCAAPSSPEELKFRTWLFHSFLIWLFEQVIMSLLATTFYITETMMHRNQMFYYRREVWSRVNALGFENMLSRGMLRHIPTEIAKDILEKRVIGACHIRYLPKAQGLRPIVNMKKSYSSPENAEHRNSINASLKSVHEVLTHEAYSSSKNLLASSLLTNAEVHSKILNFRRSLLPSSLSTRDLKDSDLPKLYFVKIDVVSAFDEIRQDKLMKILEEDVVTFERYLAVLISKTRVEKDRARHFTLRSFVAPSDQRSFEELLEAHPKKGTNSVLSKPSKTEFIDRGQLLSLLREHITRHFIKFGGKFYLQERGIPQGSTLSSLLCSLYFAHLEKTHLRKFLEEDVSSENGDGKGGKSKNLRKSVLLRWIDDFLFITTDRENAIEFFDTMHAGFEDYGTRCNSNKSQVNFKLKSGDQDVIDVSRFSHTHTQFLDTGIVDGGDASMTTSGRNEMIWCGWLINTQTLHIRRAIPDKVYMTQVVTNTLAEAPGISMSRKLHAFLRNSVYPMLFDPQINTRTIALENACDVAIWTSMRIIALVKGSYFANTLEKDQKKLRNSKFIVDMILSLIEHFRSTLEKKSNSGKKDRPVFRAVLGGTETTLIFLQSFLLVFNQHRPLYTLVIDSLRALLKEKEKSTPGDLSKECYKAASNRFPTFSGFIF